jgi:hypothetical protein
MKNAPFQLYHNEVVLADNTIILETNQTKYAYLTHNAFSYLVTSNEKFVESTHKWMINLTQKSTMISSVAEKQRMQFFSLLLDKIKWYKSKITLYI